jgi:hypothetical protein
MKKHEIAVFIENEEMLKEARELLEKYGEDVASDGTFCLTESPEANYLNSLYFDEWFLGYNDLLDFTLITLPQLEEILKNQ